MSTNVSNSALNDFHLLAFSSSTTWPLLIFVCVLFMYLLTVLGNLLIVALVCLVSHLQTPMYFFLCNLAAQDIVHVSNILPKLLSITITGDTSISFSGCITQIFLFVVCIEAEFFLLAAMAYDRYVAICIPLRYPLIMNKKTCMIFAFNCWTIYSFNALLFSLLISELSFCNSLVLDHIFCDLKSVMKLACNDITHIRDLINVEAPFMGFIPFLITITSYGFIISTILKIRTSSGRLKTFSSCSSHLVVVILFCGTSFGLYMKPEYEHSEEQDKLLSLLYVAVVPMLNPLVYSLRNKDVWAALKTIIKKYF